MTKRFTSASANKYLKGLQDDKDHLLESESRGCTYVLSAGEEADPPKYSYEDVRAKIDEIDAATLKIRHAVHLFNAHTMLPENGMTIDEALIAMAQLTAKKSRLSLLRNREPKERNGLGYFGSDLSRVEYTYANYDVAQADADYRAVCEKISQLQLELDLINQTQAFDIEL